MSSSAARRGGPASLATRDGSGAAPPLPGSGLRSLTARHWRLALAGGLALGLASGGAAQMWNLSAHLKSVWTGLAVGISFALCLLPLAAFADGLDLKRWQRWAAFTLAGCLTAVASYAIAFSLIGWHVLNLRDAPPVFLFWVTFPPLAMTGILAALGYMQWSDARRRAHALHNLRIERLRFARRTYEARLSALQARVDPAFLFGALSDIERHYATDPALGARVLDDLIVHLRAALPDADEPSSSLAIELRLIESWLAIKRAQAPGRITAVIDAGEAPADAKMPPMVLLPLVQYAASVGGGGPAAVTVTAAVHGDRVTVSVVGPAQAFSPPGNAPTIDPIRERVAGLYAESATLTLTAIDHCLSQATLEVPYDPTDRRPR